jgi:small GTP-binding protein
MEAKEVKVVLVGNTRVGKTCLIQSYLHHGFAKELRTTVGPERQAATQRVHIGFNVELAIWDTAGQEQYHSLGRIFLRNTAVGCICYDPLDPDSAFAVQRWRNELLEQSAGCNVVLVATKNDLIPDLAALEKQPADVAEDSGIDLFFVTSSKTGEGVEDLFASIAQLAINEAAPKVPVGVEVAPVATESSGDCPC